MGALRKRVFTALLAVIMPACFAGCMRIAAEDLYSLPQLSEQYLRLQGHINAVLNSGAEFSPPTGGPNRQSVQMKDLNGNGVDEVIAFFSVPGEGVLRILIFEMVDGDYTVACVIEGFGTTIDSVRYASMNGGGFMQIIVGWEMSAGLKNMSIYAIDDFESVWLTGAEFSSLTVFDMNGDGFDDVIVLRPPMQESGAVAEVFSLAQDGTISRAETRLSGGIEAISRVLTGYLIDGVPAIFVESEGKFLKGSLVTDICTYRDGLFSNISCVGPGGVSEATVRPRTPRVHSSDINKDGVIKVPMPWLMRAQSETEYYAIDWYGYSSGGSSRLLLTTYNNDFDEWYLTLPFDWRGNVSVRREDAVSGERTVVFSYIAGEDEPFEDFLKIYKLSGDKAAERVALPGRILLKEEGAAIYAFELLAEPNSFGLTFDESVISRNFKLIYSDWLSAGQPE